MQSVLSVFVNEKVWNTIPEGDRKIIADTMFEVGQKTLQLDKDTFDKYRKDLEGKGMTFVTEKEGLDVDAFRKAVLAQINKDFPEWSTYITQIQAVKEVIPSPPPLRGRGLGRGAAACPEPANCSDSPRFATPHPGSLTLQMQRGERENLADPPTCAFLSARFVRSPHLAVSAGGAPLSADHHGGVFNAVAGARNKAPMLICLCLWPGLVPSMAVRSAWKSGAAAGAPALASAARNRGQRRRRVRLLRLRRVRDHRQQHEQPDRDTRNAILDLHGTAGGRRHASLLGDRLVLPPHMAARPAGNQADHAHVKGETS
jgi:hypothetical protein